MILKENPILISSPKINISLTNTTNTTEIIINKTAELLKQKEEDQTIILKNLQKLKEIEQTKKMMEEPQTTVIKKDGAYYQKMFTACKNDTICKACGGNGCTQCASHSEYNNITGLCYCDTRRYKNDTTHSCEKCSVLCQECSSGSGNGCISCIEHAVLIGTSKCACAKGFVFDKITKSCSDPLKVFKIPHRKPLDCKNTQNYNVVLGECEDITKTSKPKYLYMMYHYGATSPRNLDVTEESVKYKDFLGLYWSNPNMKAITPLGIRQDYLYGRWLREKYVLNYKLLNDSHVAKDITVISANTDQAIIASYSVGTAFFPELKLKDNINITRSKNESNYIFLPKISTLQVFSL